MSMSCTAVLCTKSKLFSVCANISFTIPHPLLKLLIKIPLRPIGLPIKQLQHGKIALLHLLIFPRIQQRLHLFLKILTEVMPSRDKFLILLQVRDLQPLLDPHLRSVHLRTGILHDKILKPFYFLNPVLRLDLPDLIIPPERKQPAKSRPERMDTASALLI